MNKAMHMFWKFNLCVITKSDLSVLIMLLSFLPPLETHGSKLHFWASSWVGLEERKIIGTCINKVKFKQELDLYLLKGFSWNGAVLSAYKSLDVLSQWILVYFMEKKWEIIQTEMKEEPLPHGALWQFMA